MKDRGVSQGGVSPLTLSIVFVDDISGALHADELALWTKTEQVTTAVIRLQEAINLFSDWTKEWLVNDQQNQD